MIQDFSLYCISLATIVGSMNIFCDIDLVEIYTTSESMLKTKHGMNQQDAKLSYVICPFHDTAWVSTMMQLHDQLTSCTITMVDNFMLMQNSSYCNWSVVILNLGD